MGARVVNVPNRGYGNALMGGIAAARGKYIIMGDADDSYDFLEIPKYLEKLRQGYDLVQGCRLPSGGGRVMPGAMPFLHRWWGNPMFSLMARWWFYAPIHDVYCGLRGFTKDLYHRLNLRCTGMEFATEMIIKASLYSEKMTEVPITLHPRRSYLSRSSSQDLPRRLAHAPLLPHLQPALAVLSSWCSADCAWPCRLRDCHAGSADRGGDLRCAHVVIRKFGDSVRLSIYSVRDLLQDVCHQRRIVAGKSAHDSLLSGRRP